MTRIRAALALTVASLTVLLVAFVGSAGARVSIDGGYEPLFSGGIGEIKQLPLGLDRAPTTVVVQVAGESVAEVQGAREEVLSNTEKQRIRDQVRARQGSVRSLVQQLGGRILADYQDALNGIKVQIDRGKVDDLESLPNVVAVRSLMKIVPTNVNGVPLVNAPATWNGVRGFRGERVKVAIIDTGIDYTHANFGGKGTEAAFDAADAADTAPADPTQFGPNAPKIKGGFDFVGDDYDAGADDGSPALVPHPDPNPLDCNGHGSHVAGSAAGFGVTADGKQYKGSYNANTISSNQWNVGPGVAPKADLYALRVFGCEGSTDVTVDAINWAVANDMDVINMSLGSVFGSPNDATAIASTNAAKAGVIVVAAAGNAGPNQYITDSPGSGTGVISVAANDSTASFPGATMTTPSGPVTAINANGQAFSTSTWTIKKLVNDTATPEDESIGCSVAAFGAIAPNTIAVVNRGTCARVAKAIFGQQAGAAAVLMVNNADVLPPFEGKITSNPDDGTPFTVTIPFLGVKISDGPKFVTGNSTTVTPITVTNTNFRGFASFSSGGPRADDSALKPDVTAPGVSIFSTGIGTGNNFAIISGTSMATPHVAGVAALVRQSHRLWFRSESLKAAIVNTADPAGVLNHRISRGGAGLVNALNATKTDAVAIGDRGTSSLSYGFHDLGADFNGSKLIEVRNISLRPMRFAVASELPQGSAHSVSFNRSEITVWPLIPTFIRVTLNVPAATVGDASAFREVAGMVKLTPLGGSNSGVSLRVPYYIVPRANSKLDSSATSPTAPTTVNVANSGVISGDADFYAWGLEDADEPADTGTNDLRALGVQSFPAPTAAAPTRQLLVFGVSTWHRFSNVATNEFDIFVDVDNNGSDDYVVVGADVGALTAGAFNGQMGSFVFSTRSPGAGGLVVGVVTDGTTVLLPAFSTAFCRTGEPCLSQATNPRITYSAVGFDVRDGSFDEMTGTARYNVWSSSISQGMFASIPPGGSAAFPVAINPVEWAQTPAKGVMVVTHDDKSGADEADLVPITLGG